MADQDNLDKSNAIDEAVIGSRGGIATESPSSLQDSKKLDQFSRDEETLIIRMYKLVGERWPLIAGRIPGRSAEEIEKYWKSRHSSSIENNKLRPDSNLDVVIPVGAEHRMVNDQQSNNNYNNDKPKI